ncbi:BA75_01456T0 [Komagataella pastoris]|uniref:BA75_01456T0 n=1 Tax=Komagataella pastoris TaxID=4922 RepID=A0A1B2J9G9_PICPA|nr:BA75_01456T0 [Komagataella pastoris]
MLQYKVVIDSMIQCCDLDSVSVNDIASRTQELFGRRFGKQERKKLESLIESRFLYFLQRDHLRTPKDAQIEKENLSLALKVNFQPVTNDPEFQPTRISKKKKPVGLRLVGKLARFFNTEFLSAEAAVERIKNYAKFHEIFDYQRNEIYCDEPLKKLLESDRVSVDEVGQIVSKYTQPLSKDEILDVQTQRSTDQLIPRYKQIPPLLVDVLGKGPLLLLDIHQKIRSYVVKKGLLDGNYVVPDELLSQVVGQNKISYPSFRRNIVKWIHENGQLTAPNHASTSTEETSSANESDSSDSDGGNSNVDDSSGNSTSDSELDSE